jgi:uncharacterized membrane protein YoaK (UPF0700 family)
LWALGGFVVGAALGGRLSRSGWTFRGTLGLLAGLLAVAAAIATAIGDAPEPVAPSTVAILLCLAAAMGVQNAVVRHLGVADMTTTVLTLTITGMAADSRIAGGADPRIARRSVSVVAMLAGAAIGAWLYGRAVRWTLIAAAGMAVVAWITAERGAVERVSSVAP